MKNILSLRVSLSTSATSEAFAYATKTLNYLDNSEALQIGSYAFATFSNLVSVHLKNCLSIYGYAFSGCYNLAAVKLDSVNLLSYAAFYGCTKLESMYIFTSSVPSLDPASVFASTPLSDSSLLGHFGSIYVPASLPSFSTAYGWAAYSSRFVFLTDAEMTQINELWEAVNE